MLLRMVVFFCAMLLAFAHPVQASDFQAWLQDFRAEAAAKGVSQQTIARTLDDPNLAPIARVIELDRRQPEGTTTFEQYIRNIVSPARIQRGKQMYARHRALLEEISAAYGVAPQYIVALWGIETNYGSNTGGYGVVPALATLAWEGRRGDFFRQELLNALTIIDQGHITADRMKGSWAGAMGQCQFMPSSFLRFAVDHDGDGKRDIWTTHADVFASTANYLAKSGWQKNMRWGRQVRLPAGYKGPVGLETQLELSQWAALGIRRADGGSLPQEPGLKASLILPGVREGQTINAETSAFIIYENFRVLMRWNRSQYFATSVGLLADSITRH